MSNSRICPNYNLSLNTKIGGFFTDLILWTTKWHFGVHDLTSNRK